MKRHIILFCILSLAGGCEYLESPFGDNPRYGRVTYGYAPGQRDSSVAAQEAAPPDTILWTCVVKVPEDYDWAKDSSAGRFSGELVLYKESEAVLVLGAGGESQPSVHPGTHHLVDGHLYSEYCSGEETFILKDGSPFLRYEGCEILKGLLSCADGILSLGCNPSEGSLILRKNGVIQLNVAGGTVLGGFGESHPALYSDEGHHYFSFINEEGLFCVCDGSIKAVRIPFDGYKGVDWIHHGGKGYLLVANKYHYCLYSEGQIQEMIGGRNGLRLALVGKRIYTYGTSDYVTKACSYAMEAWSKEILYYRGNDVWLIWSGEEPVAIKGRDPLMISRKSASPKDAQSSYMSEESVLLTGECCSNDGEHFYLGVSRPGSAPLILRDGKPMMEFKFNGYITAVDVQVTAPSL